MSPANNAITTQYCLVNNCKQRFLLRASLRFEAAERCNPIEIGGQCLLVTLGRTGIRSQWAILGNSGAIPVQSARTKSNRINDLCGLVYCVSIARRRNWHVISPDTGGSAAQNSLVRHPGPRIEALDG